MALLAGPRRKQKLGFDPNNTNWARDNNAIGQSLLKKMGWKEGAGLGANEDGIVVPVKASMKSDNRGLGCTAQQADAWIAHQEEFDKILASLNGSADKEDSGIGPLSSDNTKLEAKENKEEGQRRFYGRFSRGGVKQLRTTEDLDCILGRRKSVKKSKEEKESKKSLQKRDDQDQHVDGVDSKDEETEKSHGFVTTTSSCSVQDYFAQKMKQKNLPPILQIKKEELTGVKNEEDQTKWKEPFTSGGCTVQDYFAQKMKAKKERRAETEMKKEIESSCAISDGIECEGELTSKKDHEKKGKVKKKEFKSKKQSKETDEEEEVIISNDGEDIKEEIEIVEQENPQNLKKKKKKRKKTVDEELEVKKEMLSDAEVILIEEIENSVISVGSDREGEESSKNGKLKEMDFEYKKRMKEEDEKVVISDDDEIKREVESVEMENSQDFRKKNKKRKRKKIDEVEKCLEMAVDGDLKCKEKKNKKRKITSNEQELVEDSCLGDLKGKEKKDESVDETVICETIENGDMDSNCKHEVEIKEKENAKNKNKNKKYNPGNKKNCDVERRDKFNLETRRKQLLQKKNLSQVEMMLVLDNKKVRNNLKLVDDYFFDELKRLKQADSFQEHTKHLCVNLIVKLREKGDESTEKGDKKLKKSLTKDTSKKIEEMCAEVQSVKSRALKRLKKNRRRNISLVKEYVTENGGGSEIDLSKQLEVFESCYKASHSEILKIAEETKQQLNNVLQQFIDELDNKLKEVKNDLDNKPKILPSHTDGFPGAVEVQGY